jgi:uncharacterized membrane protein
MQDNLTEYLAANKKNLVLVYVLYLCSIVAPMLSLIGVVFAYIHQDTSNRMLSSHYLFLYRTFWISVILSVISFVTTIIFIGFIIYGLFSIWFIARMAFGLKYLVDNKEHPNPLTFFIK